MLFTKEALLLLSLVLMLVGWFGSRENEVAEITPAQINRVKSISSERIEEANQLLEKLNTSIIEHGVEKAFDILQKSDQGTLEEKGQFLFCYVRDTLKIWTSNHVPIDKVLTRSLLEKPFIRLDNGWYFVNNLQNGKYKMLSFTLLKNEYPYENKFISNSLHESYGINQAVNLTQLPDEENGSKEVSVSDQIGFYLNLKEIEKKQQGKRYWPAILMVLGWCFFLFFLIKAAQYFEEKTQWWGGVIFLTSIVLILRYITLDQGFPAAFTKHQLFDPGLFGASWWFPSLGDFFINAVLFLFIVGYLSFVYHKRNTSTTVSLPLTTLITVVGMFLLFSIGRYITTLLKHLVEDSNIYFNINHLFDLSFYSILGIVIAAFLFLAYFFLVKTFMTFVVRNKVPENRFYFWLVLATAAFVIYAHFYGWVDMILVLWPFAILLIVSITSYRKYQKLQFSFVVTIIFVFSFFAAHIFTKYTREKEKKDRVLLAEKLATDEDPETEYLFALMSQDLANEPVLVDALVKGEQMNKEVLEAVLRTKYFKRHWDKYELEYFLFGRDSLPVGVDITTPSRDFNKLNKIIQNDGDSAGDNGLYYIHNSKDKLSYLIKLEIKKADSLVGFFFTELKSKKIPEDIGFPELLINQNTKTLEELSAYSYARYVNGELVNFHGNYEYSISAENMRRLLEKEGEPYTYMNKNEYNHLVYGLNDEDNTLIVLSRQQETTWSRLTTFSYMFSIFSLVVLLAGVGINAQKGLSFTHLSLTSKVQLLLIGIVLTSLVLFVLGTRYYIENAYKEKNANLIHEKVQSVKTELFHKLGNQKKLGNDLKPYMAYLLNKFSKVFFTDINLYHPDGTLLASSRPQLFNEGLLSRKIHPKAYTSMSFEKKSEFIHEEQVGNLTYLSAYVPFFNDDGNLLAYLNLPYFARQNELENEITDFIVAVINIFVVLFALIVITALFISNWITRPLKLLQESLSKIELGKTNQAIQYRGSDEIASLVEEYNRKVQELQVKAEQLAKSERESAWREMAKQVAHEIKNPLTPMKLSVQHLERSFSPEDPDFKEKLQRFSNNMIQQIDTLSHIASEFSNFAKMPKPNAQEMDLLEVVPSAVDILRENTQDVEITFENNNGDHLIVFADKEQIIRVLNNLVKNAVQAIPDDRKGTVKVAVKSEESKAIIAVQDNGSGIPEDQKNKIFVPNFTTKSTGMGLGLAMVKNIVETAGGQIYFDSQPDEGTTFYVEIPLLKEGE